MRFLSVCILFLWGLALSGAEPVRTWTDLKGRAMEASFIKYSGDKIVIKRTDGRVFTVSPTIFSAADQKYLTDLKKAVDAPNQTNAKSSTANKDKLGKSFKTHLVPSAGNLEMIWVEPGKFMMGSPASFIARGNDGGKIISDEVQHQVTLTKGFYLGKYEVTQAQWERVMGNNPSKFKGADRPVEQVSWTDAVDFCNKLTEMEKKAGRVPQGMAYQLPTESQWEYACRAGTTTIFSWGNSAASTQANFDGTQPYGSGASGIKIGQTVDVGQYGANPWGFFDMHGNVWEWCADWYEDYPKGAVTDPTGPTKPSGRVIRGGSWNYGGTLLYSALRLSTTPSDRIYNLGFRVGFQASK